MQQKGTFEKNGPGAIVHEKYIFTDEGITASTKMAPGFIFTGPTVYGGEKWQGPNTSQECTQRSLRQ